MNSPPIDLINAHLDGKRLTEEEAKRLSAWTKADPANARTVVELAFIHTQSEYLFSIPRFLKELGDSAHSRSIDADTSCEIADPTPEPRRFHANPGWWRKEGVRWAAIATMLLVGAFGMSQLRTPVDITPEPAVAKSVPPNTPQPVVATVTESLGVLWDRADKPRRGLHVRRNESVELFEGVLLLTTASGSEVVVQAPAQFRFDEEDQIDLSTGRLTARVEGVPTGLTVNTPTAKVVDLGTEFGVGVGDERDTIVAVCDGAVELSGRGDESSDNTAVKLVTAGRSGYVGPDGTVRWIVETLRHDREFIRPDEITSLRKARAGSEEARQQLAYFSLQRTDGLLGFQSFDIPSSGAAYSQAFRHAPVRSSRTISFSRDLVKGRLYSSGSLHVEADQNVFLDLDTSTDSPLARAGLLTERGKVGRSDTQLWLAWKSQAITPDQPGDYAGVSLMFGDTHLRQEPLFLGSVDGEAKLSIVANVGSRSTKLALDADPSTFTIDPLLLDDKVHQWVARIVFTQRADEVSVWCDVPIDELTERRPLAELKTANVAFDRIRLGVGRDGGAWRFDDFYLGASLQSLSAASRVLDGSPHDMGVSNQTLDLSAPVPSDR